MHFVQKQMTARKWLPGSSISPVLVARESKRSWGGIKKKELSIAIPPAWARALAPVIESDFINCYPGIGDQVGNRGT